METVHNLGSEEVVCMSVDHLSVCNLVITVLLAKTFIFIRVNHFTIYGILYMWVAYFMLKISVG